MIDELIGKKVMVVDSVACKEFGFNARTPDSFSPFSEYQRYVIQNNLPQNELQIISKCEIKYYYDSMIITAYICRDVKTNVARTVPVFAFVKIID